MNNTEDIQAIGLVAIENIYELMYVLDLKNIKEITDQIKKSFLDTKIDIINADDLQLGQFLIYFSNNQNLSEKASILDNIIRIFNINFTNNVFVNVNIAFLDIDNKDHNTDHNFENHISILKICLDKISKNSKSNMMIWHLSKFSPNKIIQNFSNGKFINKILYNKQLKFAFQPIIDSKTGETAYHECLLRVIDDKGKIGSIGPYINISEHYRMISLIDYIVLDMAIEELSKCSYIKLSFNISNVSVFDKKWLKYALSKLKDPQINERIIIELTETSVQKDLRTVAYFVACLQDAGCKIAIDDFGAGYTSFRQLKAIPVDIVKIDGAFIKDIVTNYENKIFVESLLNITKNFGVKSVAEFVENGEIAKALIDLEVDYMQGNYFGEAAINRTWNLK